MYSTNYYNTFIPIPEENKIQKGTIPTLKEGKKSIAYFLYENIIKHPYQYTSNELLFKAYIFTNGIDEADIKKHKIQFFSKKQLDLRGSSLVLSYGWGIHFNAQGKIALIGIDSNLYSQLTNDTSIQKVKALKIKRK